ncbi:MAG: hypothetical protein N2511_02750 [Thermodesulfovibrionales bacterium]|nr:hypothetical protein [Thermodesulfovibrionales bacterium]
MNKILNTFISFAEKENILNISFLVGGSVRDFILKNEIHDYDITISGDVLSIIEKFSKEISGTFVLLDERYGIVRVVKEGDFIDFCSMKGETIKADLSLRDFTINAMAINLVDYVEYLKSKKHNSATDFPKHLIIDPFDGMEDLNFKLIRMISEDNLLQDPLRILRAYRFSATLDFIIESATYEAICKLSEHISKSAVERILEELKHIFLVKFSYQSIKDMYKSSLLLNIFPELRDLDSRMILDNIRSYECLEHILNNLSDYFSEHAVIENYFRENYRMISLKLAILLSTKEIVDAVIERMRVSKKMSQFISSLLELYRTFMLYKNSNKKEKIAFLRTTGNDLYSLIIYAIAKEHVSFPQDNSLLHYCQEMLNIYNHEIIPKKGLLPIITGDDLIKELNLHPSPLFKFLLKEIELLFLEGSIRDKKEALEKAKDLFETFYRRR